ncbi:hypothetical protein JTE90_010177 [Oedothorax gibbosus]|uniref:Uncharacterized protein n=1 Tax=Oedothorax gibbosus TaxID=931172 RepID=A0AAV6TFZ7_9ARAC|nr:hypothetical protein JTE90_010177 [Oedothorax gibbosus]
MYEHLLQKFDSYQFIETRGSCSYSVSRVFDVFVSTHKTHPNVLSTADCKKQKNFRAHQKKSRALLAKTEKLSSAPEQVSSAFGKNRKTFERPRTSVERIWQKQKNFRAHQNKSRALLQKPEKNWSTQTVPLVDDSVQFWPQKIQPKP